ncbi:MAG: alpha/beta hydrolase, partial [Deltaproteobacteria bacterium]|nr:alpha/beta hydrolase [Deltaproteobacteria bacterium]
MTKNGYGIDAPIREGRVKGWDGTEIAYYVGGSGTDKLVMAPGLGTPFITWKYLIEKLQDRYTIVTWDPRGTYRSAIPSATGRMKIEDHVRDMVSVCEAEGLDRFHLGGWSMGVQICLEYCHQFPQAAQSLMLIAGAFQHVLSTALNVPFSRGILTTALVSARALSPVIGPAASMALRSGRLINILGVAGMVTGNRPHFARMARELSYTDWHTYFDLILQYDRHSAAPYLSSIRIPTLVMAGDSDKLTPMPVSIETHRAIPGSELFVVHRGTHYLLVEFPEVVNTRI